MPDTLTARIDAMFADFVARFPCSMWALSLLRIELDAALAVPNADDRLRVMAGIMRGVEDRMAGRVRAARAIVRDGAE